MLGPHLDWILAVLIVSVVVPLKDICIFTQAARQWAPFFFFIVVVVLVVLHVWYMIMSQLYLIVYIVSHTVHINGQ